MSGFLGHIGQREEKRDYQGARGNRFRLFPGSDLGPGGPKWVMAASLVETSRLFARTAARIQPGWIEEAAAHLLKREPYDAHWNAARGQVDAFERVSLYGLTLRHRRRVPFGPIDPAAAREIFIRSVFVERQSTLPAPFFQHNEALRREVETLEAKLRRRDLLVDDERLAGFYAARLPGHVCAASQFERWREEAERTRPRLLYMSREDLLRYEPDDAGPERFPDDLDVAGNRLPLHYRFEPGEVADGVTLSVPAALVNELVSSGWSPGCSRRRLSP